MQGQEKAYGETGSEKLRIMVCQHWSSDSSNRKDHHAVYRMVMKKNLAYRDVEDGLLRPGSGMGREVDDCTWIFVERRTKILCACACVPGRQIITRDLAEFVGSVAPCSVLDPSGYPTRSSELRDIQHICKLLPGACSSILMSCRLAPLDNPRSVFLFPPCS